MKFMRFRKPRINMVIGKKQIIIAGLSLLLGLAVFTNYAVNANRNAQPSAPVDAVIDGANADVDADVDGEPDANANADGNHGANYGDSQFVSGGNIVNEKVEAFFASARLSKRESRDEAKEFLQSIIEGGDVRADEIQAIAFDAASLGGFIESESRIEAVLKAQGFSDALCYISDKGTNVIVRTDGLTAQDAAKIKDALLSEVDVSVENITILEVK